MIEIYGCIRKVLILTFRNYDINLPARALKSHPVEYDSNDVRTQVTHLEAQFVDIADGRVIVHGIDGHASGQSEISIEIFVIVHF